MSTEFKQTQFLNPIGVDTLEKPFEGLPTGTYYAMIKDAEIKLAKSNNGNEYIKLTWQVLEGRFAGFVCYQNINYLNSNEVAQSIGERMLRKVMELANIMLLSDTTQLVGIRADILVNHEEANAKNGGIASSVIKDVKPHFASVRPTMPNYQNATPSIPNQTQPSNFNQFMQGQNRTTSQPIQNNYIPQPSKVQQSNAQIERDPFHGIDVLPGNEEDFRAEVDGEYMPQEQGGPEDFIGDDIPNIGSKK